MPGQQVNQINQQSKSQAPLVNWILQRAAVYSIADNEVKPNEEMESGTFRRSRFEHDFSQTPIHTGGLPIIQGMFWERIGDNHLKFHQEEVDHKIYKKLDEPTQPRPSSSSETQVESYPVYRRILLEDSSEKIDQSDDEYFDAIDEAYNEIDQSDDEYFDATDEGYDDLTRESPFLAHIMKHIFTPKDDGSFKRSRKDLINTLESIPLDLIPPSVKGLLEELRKNLKALETNNVALTKSQVRELNTDLDSQKLLEKLNNQVKDLIAKNPNPKNQGSGRDKNKERYAQRQQEKLQDRAKAQLLGTNITSIKTDSTESNSDNDADLPDQLHKTKTNLTTMTRSEVQQRNGVIGNIAKKGIKEVRNHQDGLVMVENYLTGQAADGRSGHAHMAGGSHTFMWDEQSGTILGIMPFHLDTKNTRHLKEGTKMKGRMLNKNDIVEIAIVDGQMYEVIPDN
ncbi:hypothetical protein ACE1CI_17920 [Aerosakkonemataceae cyanobacterium BLCC-F50]|uniref:Uncharacterized protein n=1 Tax=Floridaenema flaviceps BLCC-F50 TaxID=3153642 RepID=A0ABV4XSU5_9CYAN